MHTLDSLGLIGGGQMGEALIRGLLAAEKIEAHKILAAEPFAPRQAYLHNTYQVQIAQTAQELAACKVVLFAVKPQIMAPVMAEYRDQLHEDQLILSIAAGVRIEQLEEGLGAQHRIIRIMPNTPALVLAGASAMSGNHKARPEDLALCEQIFSAVGTCVQVPENLLDAVTGLSGSGPGYVFTFLEALIDGGVLAGLPRPLAEQLAVQTLYGSAKLALESGQPAAVLKGQVTSPGGTTITGLQVLEQGGFRGTVMTAVQAARDRSQVLGR
jgi:pyrroline-5-carboxylate reductase